MLYCVSYPNGVVGVFSSLEKIKELVFDVFPSIVFIIQVYNNSKDIQLIEGKHTIWVIMYKDTETIAYVSDNKDEASNVVNIFNKIGKSYEDIIEYWEQDIDTIPECTYTILESLQKVYHGIIVDSSENIIYYV